MFFIPLVVSLTSLLCSVSCCDHNCTDKPVFTPSRLFVKHGSSTSATCSVCQSCTDLFNLERAVGDHTTNGTTITWTVNNMTEWKTKPQCYYSCYEKQCRSILFVTVYKPPDSVSIRLNHSGPMLEARQYTLQCDVRNVAPVDNLTVTFYRGQTTLAQLLPTSNPEIKPVSEVLTLSFNASREDDGAQYWCEARLELGPDGPQPPPVVMSQNIIATVHYKPHVERSSHPDPIVVTEGGRLQLNCSAEGNPPPSFTWRPPGRPGHLLNGTTLIIDPVTVKDEGQYVCFIRNNMGTVNATFNVSVKATTTLPPTTTATTTAPTTTTTTAATTTATTTTAATTTTTATTTTAATTTTTATTTTAATTTTTAAPTTPTTSTELTTAPSSSTSIAVTRWFITWLMILSSLVI